MTDIEVEVYNYMDTHAVIIGNKIVPFVRENKKKDGLVEAYIYL